MKSLENRVVPSIRPRRYDDLMLVRQLSEEGREAARLGHRPRHREVPLRRSVRRPARKSAASRIEHAVLRKLFFY